MMGQNVWRNISVKLHFKFAVNFEDIINRFFVLHVVKRAPSSNSSLGFCSLLILVVFSKYLFCVSRRKISTNLLI